MDAVAERLNELEIRYTHQSHLLEELSDELTRAYGRIERLERDIGVMREMFGQLGPELEASPDE